MSAAVVIAVILLLAAAAVAVLSAARRRDTNRATGQLARETLRRDEARREADVAEEAAPGLKGREIERAAVIARTGNAVVPVGSTTATIWVPPDPETYDVTRRQFLNRSIVGLMGLGITLFAVVSFPVFLWPTGTGGFGGQINIGKISDILADIQKNKGFLYKPEGRMWVTQYPATALPKGGPAPRGLDRFPVAVSPTGNVTVDTASAKIVGGPPIGTNTTGQEAEGPHCV